MECAAAMQLNGLDVTLVFPEDRFMARLFTPEIADFYEKFYADKGIKIIKEDVVTAFEGEGQVKSSVCKLLCGNICKELQLQHCLLEYVERGCSKHLYIAYISPCKFLLHSYPAASLVLVLIAEGGHFH